MEQQELEIVVLAAGKGTRMKSSLPKVLHPLAGLPLLQHVLQTAVTLRPKRVHVVYGHGGNQIKNHFENTEFPDGLLNWVEQTDLLGTGDAVKQVLPCLGPKSTVLILYGDVPLISTPSLESLVSNVSDGNLALLTAVLDNPQGYGRIVRGTDGHVLQIIEEKDANAEQRKIQEVNTGFMALPSEKLHGWIDQLRNDNAQNEYYLTDIIELAVQEGQYIAVTQANDVFETLGINDRSQLARLERVLQARQAEALMAEGVTIVDPARFDQRGTVQVGQDVVIDVGVVLEGNVVLGDNVKVGPYTTIKDSVVQPNTKIEAHCAIEGAALGEECAVGPFARLRPGASLERQSRVGNFVEIKNSVLGEASKVNHLSYIGDSALGRDVNIGAGTITCNYDGANKHQTTIGDRVFVGSCTQLVAPVCLGDDATVGAGSTITRDVPSGELSLTRAPQRFKKDWKRPVKENKEK